MAKATTFSIQAERIPEENTLTNKPLLEEVPNLESMR